MGWIVAQSSAIVGESDAQLLLGYDPHTDAYHVRVSVPAGSYPVGTLVTARLVIRIGTPDDSRTVLRYTSGVDCSALQLLPAALVPASPLRLELANPFPENDTVLLLHAREADPVWSLLGEVDENESPMSIALSEPGLWTLAPKDIDDGSYRTLDGGTRDVRE